jgi:putative solute:sodium symporter small subunit
MKGSETLAERPTHNAYWAANIRVILISLAVWFVASYGMGILLRPALSGISVGGADLGFWMAQNGAIYVFLILIFVYARVMNRLDREHGVEE